MFLLSFCCRFAPVPFLFCGGSFACSSPVSRKDFAKCPYTCCACYSQINGFAVQPPLAFWGLWGYPHASKNGKAVHIPTAWQLYNAKKSVRFCSAFVPALCGALLGVSRRFLTASRANPLPINKSPCGAFLRLLCGFVLPVPADKKETQAACRCWRASCASCVYSV